MAEKKAKESKIKGSVEIKGVYSFMNPKLFSKTKPRLMGPRELGQQRFNKNIRFVNITAEEISDRIKTAADILNGRPVEDKKAKEKIKKLEAEVKSLKDKLSPSKPTKSK